MCFDNNNNNSGSGNTKENTIESKNYLRSSNYWCALSSGDGSVSFYYLFIALCYFRFPMYKFTLVVCPHVIDRLVVVMHLELRQPVYHDPIEVICKFLYELLISKSLASFFNPIAKFSPSHSVQNVLPEPILLHARLIGWRRWPMLKFWIQKAGCTSTAWSTTASSQFTRTHIYLWQPNETDSAKVNYFC